MLEISTQGSDGPVQFIYNEATKTARITLNRPRSLNAINTSLLTALVSCLRDVQSLKCLVCVLQGAGSCFCSGEDLKETLAPRSEGRDPVELRIAFEQLQEITRLMTTSDTVFIAAVRGWAIGGGAEIALAADMVIASPDAAFKFPEVIHGHAPTGGITGRLPLLVGLLQAKRLLLLGEKVSAVEALSLNMITEVADDPVLRANDLAAQLSQHPGRSLSTVKKGLEAATFPNIESTLNAEITAADWCFADERASEAYEIFKNRRDGQPTRGASASDQESPETLISLLRKASDAHSNKAFLRFGTIDITYGCFADSVGRLVTGLLGAGIQKGDVITAMMINCEEMVRFWFASMSVGAIWAPLHTEFRGITLQRALELIAPKIMIIDEAFLVHLPSGTNVQLYVKPEGTSSQLHRPWSSLIGSSQSILGEPSPCATSCLLFTSGTTGPSKACELSHQYFISVGRALINALRFNSDDVLFCPFPLCHADATSLTVIPALLLGTTAAISQRFSASRWWDEIRQTRSTIADFMGATLSILFKAPAYPSDVNNTLRMMWGVPVPAWVEDFEQRFNLKIYEVYGSTETGLPVIQPIDQARVAGSCGVALRGIGLRIVDEAGIDVKAGVVGELLVRQVPGARFSGYYKDAEATSKSLRGGWFYTGDLCRLDANGNLFFVGRRKHVIRRRGENISAFEVEEGLLLHPDILECAAYGVPSELTEEDVKVSVVKRPGSELVESDVRAFAVKTMARFQVPRYVEFVDVLPRTPTGKLEIFKLQNAWVRGERVSVKDFENL